jgi:hypothetical protein
VVWQGWGPVLIIRRDEGVPLIARYESIHFTKPYLFPYNSHTQESALVCGPPTERRHRSVIESHQTKRIAWTGAGIYQAFVERG